MRFGQPSMLWLIPAFAPLLALFFVWAWRERRRLVAQFVQSRLLAVLTVGVSGRRIKARYCLLTVAVTLLLLCLSRPQYGFDWEEAHQRGLDIVVAIDISRSMLATDVAPNRLERAKLAALDLAAQAKSDRLALVAFAGSAFLQCPLTLDEAAFRQSVEAVQVGLITDEGTAIADAIRTALKTYEKENDNHKILVLLTDGEDQEPGAVEAAAEASKQGMRIFTVGIGTPAGELIRLQEDKGGFTFLKDENGNVVKSRLNEAMLKDIAEKSEGFYMPLQGARPIETLYERGLAPLPKSDNSSKMVRLYHEIYHWPLALAIACLIAEMFLPNRRRSVEKPPGGDLPGFAGAAKILLAVACTAAAFSSAASPGTAYKEYQTGRFADSLKEYNRLSEKNTNDYQLHYNAGTAAYQAGQYDIARRHLSESALSPDPQVEANSFYNLGNTFFKDGEKARDPGQQVQIWENSLTNYEAALKLNPKDPDAKNNYAYVKEKVEKLKQQQSKSDQNKDKQDKKKDQDKDKDDKDKQDQNKKDQQDKKQQSDKDKQDQEKKDQEQKKGDQKDGSKDQNGDQQKPPQDQRPAQPQKADNKDPKKGLDDEELAAAAGQMTPQEALRFLDSQKDAERTLVFQPDPPPASGKKRSRRAW